MKKYLFTIFVLITTFVMSSCNTAVQNTSETNSYVITDASDEQRDNSDNMIISYFSWADNAVDYELERLDLDVLGSASVVTPGDVGIVAQYIEERTGADVFKIILTEKYSADYDECLSQALEQLSSGIMPELAETIENLDKYDIIFLGFPNWWYTIPTAINSFVEAHDLSGKTIIPFVTHGTGGLAGTIRDLTEILPDDCTIMPPYDVFIDDVKDSQNDVNKWLEELGY